MFVSPRVVLLLSIITSSCSESAPEARAASVLPAVTVIPDQDSTMRAAGRAIEEGRPYEASRLLTPVLRDPTRRKAPVVLRAAEAARAWKGWTQVIALLQNESWLDTQFAGHGNVLMAEATLSLTPRSPLTDSLALRHARRAMTALPVPGPPADQGLRHVLLARALDRLASDDSARAHYLRAGDLIPETRDWLVLRAANLTASDGARGRLYGTLRTDVARQRRDATEASALERARDFAGAATAYARSANRIDAFRMLHAAGPDSASRTSLRARMLAYLDSAPAVADARATIELFDLYNPSRAPSAELAIGRAASRSGPLPRAVAAWSAANRAGLLAERDRMSYGDVLLRLDRASEAARQFAMIPPASALAGAASYQRARALLRTGNGAAARTALRTTRTTFARDTFAAASSLYLLGDLAADAGDDAESRARFLEIARTYPSSASAPQAAVRAALLAYAAGDARTAARELDAIGSAYPQHVEAGAASYWAGRAYKSAGVDSAARSRFSVTLERRPASYYAMLAASALGTTAWAPARTSEAPLRRFADIDSASARMLLLERLGMDDEAKWEADFLVARASGSPDRLLATAAALGDRGSTSRAMSLARAALDSGAAPTVPAYRLLYPLRQLDVLRRESERRGLDPALVAALIRQESNFTPTAVSAVGARGLMQVMPAVGKSIAQGAGYPEWDAALLFQPDVNIALGVQHLAGSLRKYDDPAYALAAYNAGDSRARRWRAKRGAADPALFVELIPYVETRDYVRIVLRNRAFYRALYDWSAAR